MNIIVVGAVYVGLTTACCLANSKHRVTCVETNKAKLKLLEQGLSPIRENGINRLLKQGLASGGLSFAPSLSEPLQVDIAMLTVGTPSLPNGAADLSYVYHAAQEIRNATEQDLILAIKSTVPPGTGARLIKRYFENTPITYVSNPEFLREGQAIWDWYHPRRIVIGAEDKQTADKIRQLYFDIDAPAVFTDITSAETIKYASNAFLVTKWQEFIQADWQNIKKQMQEPYVILDGRNALTQDKLIGLGFRYIGVGRRI